MALTQQQWYEKLRKFVPSWTFEDEKTSVAVFQAIAAVLAQVQSDADASFNATFLSRSTAPILDVEGDERGVARLTDEEDSSYYPRIQRITSNTDPASIKAIVDSFLLFGECTILESPLDSPYCSRDAYCSRSIFIINATRNYFLILIPKQIHAPYAFCSRLTFTSRHTWQSNFVGSLDASDSIFASIIAAVDQAKAFGVMYGILEV